MAKKKQIKAKKSQAKAKTKPIKKGEEWKVAKRDVLKAINSAKTEQEFAMVINKITSNVIQMQAKQFLQTMHIQINKSFKA